MRCSSVLSSTRPLLIAYLLNIAAGALVVYAQTLAGADAINPGITYRLLSAPLLGQCLKSIPPQHSRRT
jgi:hypothetical protein